MKLDDGLLLRIYIGEQDRYEDEPLDQWLVSAAHTHGISGATVLRGLQGFGADGRLHTARVIRLSTDLPLVIEMVDQSDKIESFLDTIDQALQQGLVTVEKVRMKFYRKAGD
jgi:PII-like signaling protein